MEENALVRTAKEITENVVNLLANKKYSDLSKIIELDSQWLAEDKTQEEASLLLGEWLNGQLAMWSEDAEEEIVIDPFDEKAIDVETEPDRVFITYNPTSNGDDLDFWFNLDFVNKKGQLKGTLNIDI